MADRLDIDRLVIKDFQGLNGEFEFDLRSPLTIIHAPNGTGKTTICTAAKWALTGSLGKRTVESSQLECKFSKGSMPRVTIEFGQDAHFCKLIRANNSFELYYSDGAQADFKTTKLLQWLTRGAQYMGAHHIREISQRTNWLHAARFLSEEDMDHLISSDRHNTERREDIFADVLGVRELLEQENRLKRYAKELENSSGGLVGRIEEIEKEQTFISEEAADQDDTGSWPSRVAETYASMGLEPPESILPDDFPRLDEDLSAEIAEFGSETERMLLLSDKLRKAYPEFQENKSELEATQKRIEELENAVQQATDETARRITDQRTLNEEQQELEAVISAILANAEDAMSKAASLAETGTELPTLRKSMTLSAWRKVLPDSQDAAEQLEHRIQSIRHVQSRVDTINAKKEQREIALQRRDEAQTHLLSPDEQKKTKSRFLELGDELKKAKDAITEVATIREQLVALGRQFTATTPTGECPLCLQDWGNADSLRARIDKSDVSSDAVVFLRTQAEKIEQELTPLSTQLAKDDKARRTLEEITFEINECDAHLDDFSQRLKELRISLDEDDLEASLQINLDMLLACHALKQLDNVVSELRSWKVEIDISNITVAELPTTIRQAVKAREEPLRSDLRVTEEKLSQLARQIEAAHEKTAQIKSDRKVVREKEASLTNLIKKFSDDWKLLRKSEDWPVGDFLRGDARIALRREALAASRNQHAAAKAAWEAHNRSTRISELAKKRDDLQQRLTYIHDRISMCRNAATKIEDARREQERRTIHVLGDGISAIFPRIHANAMIDAIINPDEGTPFQWIARCGDVDLDPSDNLSHGQRQDLALSIFLSRAASLGGTFFIDDPITHLDDLNRVGLLDVLRALALGKGQPSRFVVTTASMQFAKLIKAKFRSLTEVSDVPPIRIYQLNGDPRSGQTLDDLSA